MDKIQQKRWQTWDLLFIFFLIAVAFTGCKESTNLQTPKPKKHTRGAHTADSNDAYAGSDACRRCHEKFYKLWDASHHGKAMQPFSIRFAQKHLQFTSEALLIGKYRYKATIRNGKGLVLEIDGDSETSYEIQHVMGGKNVYYFLTPLSRGRLQTLPLGYDVHTNEWFDVAQSGVRHAVTEDANAASINWRDPLYTFNTSCYSCHVSQLTNNYTIESDTYQTKWREPGINCETCHDASLAHIEACDNAPKGTVPKDLKIKGVASSFSPKQNNDTCNSCHAKLIPLTGKYKPGDAFFDHFDITLLEHGDYYPDGRDLGENYTMTSWLMSACVQNSSIDCVTCHTSSGRYKHANDPVASCAPCHKKNASELQTHSRHPAGEKSPDCIDCHMPMTRFARMNRSDHSMLPPTPAATIAFGSPNACNLCHKDRDARWADKVVTQWHGNARKEAVLHRGFLIANARKQNWSALDDMLLFIREEKDTVTAASLLRLLSRCQDDRVIDVAISALSSQSPLIRSSALRALSGRQQPEVIPAVLAATADASRVVRIHAASLLSELSVALPSGAPKKAMTEYIAYLTARPDDPFAHYNLGNYYLAQNKYDDAVRSYNNALKLQPDMSPVYVNLGMALYQLGQRPQARRSFEKAISLTPQSDSAHMNLGMLLGELGNISAAKSHFSKALAINPSSAQAAFNLCVLNVQSNWETAEKHCRRAVEIEPTNSKYAYTLAFYYHQHGSNAKALAVLENILPTNPTHLGIYQLLGRIYESKNQRQKAINVYRIGIEHPGITSQKKRVLNNNALKLLQPIP